MNVKGIYITTKNSNQEQYLHSAVMTEIITGGCRNIILVDQQNSKFAKFLVIDCRHYITVCLHPSLSLLPLPLSPSPYPYMDARRHGKTTYVAYCRIIFISFSHVLQGSCDCDQYWKVISLICIEVLRP